MASIWTKSWSSSDDGTILRGSDLGQLQSDIEDYFLGFSGMVSKGDILYHDGTDWVLLNIGSSGQALKVSSSGIPEWGEVSDEKVKADASDSTAGYLSDKVDDETIEVDSSSKKLKVKNKGSDLSEDGYFKFPNGLIIQWGYETVDSDTKTISFPIEFPNACLNVSLTNRKDGDTGGVDYTHCLTGTPTTTSFTISSYSSHTGVYWMAIGY